MVEIVLGGQPRKISFGLQVLGKIQNDLGVDIVALGNLIDKTNLFMLLPVIIYRGNERELLKEGKLIDYDLDKVEEWLQDVGIYSQEIVGVWSLFTQSVISYLPKQPVVKASGSKKK